MPELCTIRNAKSMLCCQIKIFIDIVSKRIIKYGILSSLTDSIIKKYFTRKIHPPNGHLKLLSLLAKFPLLRNNQSKKKATDPGKKYAKKKKQQRSIIG